MVKIIVDGKEYDVKEKYLMDALDSIGIHVPRLCKHKDLFPTGKCRMCLVEVNGKLVTSCNFEVKEGIEVKTNTDKVIKARVMNLKLILSNHPQDCLHCFRNNDCELQNLASEFSVHTLFDGAKRNYGIDESSYAITREMDKCILCGRCIEVCDAQGIHAIDYAYRSFNTMIMPAYGLRIIDTACISCGQCALYCPTAAIHERDDRVNVINAINDPKKFVVAQIAPAVRVSLSEEFIGKPKLITKKIVTALKLLGFDAVFDTSLGADVTVMEEAYEFVQRFKKKENLPLLTSCCPAWVNYVEMHHPELIKHLSTTKSPHEIMGVLIKTYFAKKRNINPEDIVVVSIMPCTAKKEEAKRTELRNEYENVDYVLTTRELAKMLKEYGINPLELKEMPFDSIVDATSAGQIFGRSGGVMEAALRTASYFLGIKLEKLEFETLRGMDGIKTATLEFNGEMIKVAVVNGIGNIDKILPKLSEYHFVEVMACPGGCIGGGGQPRVLDGSYKERVIERMQELNKIDAMSKIRQSHESPLIKQIYDEFLKHPMSEIAEKYLHTSYKNKTNFIVR